MMIKQITITEAVELMLKGEKVPCLVPQVISPDAFTDYSAAYLDDVLANVICLAEVPDGKEREPAKEEPRKRTKGKMGALTRIEVDMGKVHALLDAGWSIKKVADEMRVSQATIYDRLREEREANKEEEDGEMDN